MVRRHVTWLNAEQRETVSVWKQNKQKIEAKQKMPLIVRRGYAENIACFFFLIIMFRMPTFLCHFFQKTAFFPGYESYV